MDQKDIESILVKLAQCVAALTVRVIELESIRTDRPDPREEDEPGDLFIPGTDIRWGDLDKDQRVL